MVVNQYSQPWEDICPLFIGSRTYTSSVYAGEASHSVAVAPQFTPLTLDGALTGRWWHWQWRGKQPQSHYGRSEAKLGEQFSRRSSFRCLRRSTFSAVSLSSSMISFSFRNLSLPDVSRRLASSITNLWSSGVKWTICIKGAGGAAVWYSGVKSDDYSESARSYKLALGILPRFEDVKRKRKCGKVHAFPVNSEM